MFEQISYCNKKYKGHSIYNRQPPNNFIIPYLFYANKLVQKHNENVFTNTLGPTFIFNTMDIIHSSCSQFYKLSNDLNKTIHVYILYNSYFKRYVGRIMCW
jgi:hypothetical protein